MIHDILCRQTRQWLGTHYQESVRHLRAMTYDSRIDDVFNNPLITPSNGDSSAASENMPDEKEDMFEVPEMSLTASLYEPSDNA